MYGECFFVFEFDVPWNTLLKMRRFQVIGGIHREGIVRGTLVIGNSFLSQRLDACTAFG